MKSLIIVVLGALALNGCTGSRIKPAAVCDGKHRRPANLYGSVLPSLPVPLPASQQRGGQSAVASPSGSVKEPAPTSTPAPAPASSPASASMPGPPPTPPMDMDGALAEPAAPAAPAAPNVSPAAPRLSQRSGALTYSPC